MYYMYVIQTKYFVEFPTEKDVERWHFLFRLVNRHVSFLLGKFSRGTCSIQKKHILVVGRDVFVCKGYFPAKKTSFFSMDQGSWNFQKRTLHT